MRILPISNKILTQDRKGSHLTADVAAGSSTITVSSILGFAINQVILIGEFGNEKSEIIKTHTSTAPTGFTVTLNSTLSTAHSGGTYVTILDWDQVEISWSATTTGAKAILDTIALQADQNETLYTDTVESTGYYFVRYKNSFSPASYSEYSDPIPWGGFGTNTVNYIIQYALGHNGLADFGDIITHQFCIDEINACLQYIRGKLKKWHRLQSFNYDLGDTARGVYSYALPSDMWSYSNKCILDVRVGDNSGLTYIDKKELEDQMDGVNQTTVSVQASAGSTSVSLVNTYDFDDSGTVNIGGSDITYTSNTRSTGVLSGIPATGTGSIGSTITVGTNVWQGETEGEAEYYTVYGGSLYIWPLPGSSDDNFNIYLDYWKEAPSIDSDADTIDISRYDMVKYWLTWAIRSQYKNGGQKNLNDGDFLLFQTMLKDSINTELTGQKYKWKPRINQILYR